MAMIRSFMEKKLKLIYGMAPARCRELPSIRIRGLDGERCV